VKILHVVAAYPSRPGFGVARYAHEAARALVELGHSSHLVSSAVSGQSGSTERDGVAVHGLDMPYPFSAYDQFLQAALEDLPLAARLAETWKSSGPFDLVTAHDWAAGMAAAVLQRVYRCPLVGFLHGTEVGRAGGKVTREQHYVADMEKWFCERADRLVVPSDFVRMEARKHYHTDPRKLSVVPGGAAASLFEAEVDVEEFRRMFAEPEELLMLFAGRLEPEKGPDIILEALHKLGASTPRTRLALAGDGSIEAALREQTDRSGLGELVKFTGTLGPTVMGALLRVSDLLVIPSRYEALGITALEGVLHGLPVLAHAVGGLPELARSASRIQLVPPGSGSDLAKAISTTLSKVGMRRDRQPPDEGLIPKQFLWSEVAKSLLKVFESLFVPEAM
jgi:glycosyltransferase involved in cell wall biosynthesis